jgi:signal peptidase I
VSINDPSTPGAPEPETTQRAPKRGALLKELVLVIVAALVLSVLVKTFLFRAFVIPSQSMEDTLLVGDRVFVNLLVPGPFDLERGDVVVFKDEQHWLEPTNTPPAGPIADALTFLGLRPDDSTQHLVKRIIGMPGDTVECGKDGVLKVNGVALVEDYLKPGVAPSEVTFKAVVPEGKIWVMGDNRSNSADSRSHSEDQGGFVDIAAVEGRADIIAWPLNRIGGVQGSGDTFKDVQDREAKPYDPEAQDTSHEPVESSAQ